MNKLINITIKICLLTVLSTAAAQAADKCSSWLAKAEALEGHIDSQSYSSPAWLPVHLHDTFCPGDIIRVGAASRATLRLKNESVFTLDQKTTISFSQPEPDGVAWFLNLLEGSSFFRSRHPQRLNIQTPFLNAVHEGTEFLVAVDHSQTAISVFDGLVNARNPQGQITIGKGQIGIAQAQGGVPKVQTLTVTPTDAVQWALYYPPIFDNQSPDHQTPPDRNAAKPPTPPPQILQAAALLSAGRADLAETILRNIRQSDRQNSDALALQAIIAVSKNQHQQALLLAQQASTHDPHSAAAQVALSYAYQAAYNLDAALTAAQQAVRLSPQNTLAWARLAELQLSTGDRDAALSSAQQAQTLNPNTSKSQTVMGFAMLAANRIAEARHAFEQAISLDSSDPLPRLGLGLTKIHTGDLEGGKTELETAVNLDPNSSVTRSYLGKAHYELKNQDYASTEYQLAKELDSKDPTPWFYDAILKQTINRPIAALQAMQTAIALNNNRGVYRSRLLLDNDSAARSTSLGRIYNDLGFQQRGLLEGWNAVNNDPSNYSAHRLLADNYAALPRHEIARVSELLKAQLLQPINLTPVQPQTAESNILLLDNLGPSITSFNEYNPAFNRNRLALQASGYFDSNNTKSDEVVQSGAWDKFSYSLGQFHYQTDGYRPNNDQKKDLYNFFAQSQVSQNTNAQFEYRRSEHQYGDISQGFFANQAALLDHNQKDTDTYRGGLHHAFSERSDLLISVAHKDERFSALRDSQGYIDNDAAKTTGTQYEMQQILRRHQFDVTAGMDYLVNQQGDDSTALNLPDFIFNTGHHNDHKAAYLYTNIKVIPKLLMTMGFSQDFYQQRSSTASPLFGDAPPFIGQLDRNPANPKFGLTYSPSANTTLRFAALRSLKRGIIQKQTLEPTQVAGFNQFYDDTDGTIAKKIGLGADHKLTAQVFIGAEISRRELDVPVPTISDGYYFDKTRWAENNARAYLNWAASDDIAVGLDYKFEQLQRQQDGFFETIDGITSFFSQLETHRTQLFGNFYHPSGLLSKLNLAYLNQTGVFMDNNGYFNPQATDFWLLDAELGYRLPQRHGLVALGVKNLLDEHFNFQGTDVNSPALPQGSVVFGRLTLSF